MTSQLFPQFTRYDNPFQLHPEHFCLLAFQSLRLLQIATLEMVQSPSESGDVAFELEEIAKAGNCHCII